MAQFPAGITTGQTSRATLINDFGIVRPDAYPTLVRRYGMQNYTMIMQGLGNTKLATNNKLFFHYEEKSKAHFGVTITGTVSVAAGANATITVGASDIYDGKFAGRVNEQVQNIYTGVWSTVIAVNTSTPGAYTMTLQPLRAADNASCTSGDFLGFKGVNDIGESSGPQQTQAKLYNKISNFVTEFRDTATFTDLALKEMLDFADPRTGAKYIKPVQMEDFNQRFLNNMEFKLMFGPQSDQPINGATGSEGVFPRIQRDGGTLNYGTFNPVNTLAQIGRYLDAEGGATEYDWLCDTDQNIDIMNGLGTEFTNGAILYDQSGADQIDLKRNFKSLNIFNRKVNFIKLPAFNMGTVYGANNEGSYYQNTGLLIPQDSQIDGKTGESVPSFCVRTFDGPDGGGEDVKTTYTGMFASNNQTQTANLSADLIAYKGVQVFAAQRYMIIQK